MYLRLIHVIVWKNSIEHCKAIILQLKIKNTNVLCIYYEYTDRYIHRVYISEELS